MIEQLSPRNIWEQWNVEPSILIPLSLALVVYSVGIARSASGARGRSTQLIGRWLAFAAACGALAIALFSPIDALASQLFSVHMIQHVLLVFVAPPLLVQSSAPGIVESLLPRSIRQLFDEVSQGSSTLDETWQLIRRPATLWLAFAAVLWLWHLPFLYNLAIQNEAIHFLEHVIFLGAGTAFWHVILRRMAPRKQQIAFGANIFYTITMALQTCLLGGLLAFASTPWYSVYVAKSTLLGVKPLDDQQLAGLILWIPAGLVYVITAAVLFVFWLNAVERQLRERERQAQSEYECLEK